jgi:hypothetical protein
MSGHSVDEFVRHRGLAGPGLWSWPLVVLLLLVGCDPQHYRRSADAETARIIAEKTPQVANMDPNFTIEPTAAPSLEDLPTYPEPPDFLGEQGLMEKGPRSCRWKTPWPWRSPAAGSIKVARNRSICRPFP